MESGNDTTPSFRFHCRIESSLLASGPICGARSKQTRLCMIHAVVGEQRDSARRETIKHTKAHECWHRENGDRFSFSFSFFFKSVLLCSDQIHLCFPLTVFWTNWDIFPPSCSILLSLLTVSCSLSFSLLHLSFQPTPEVSGFHSWFTLAPPYYTYLLPLHPISLSLSSSYSSTTSCWPLAVLSDQGGFVVSSERSCLTLACSPHVAHLHSCVAAQPPTPPFFF